MKIRSSKCESEEDCVSQVVRGLGVNLKGDGEVTACPRREFFTPLCNNKISLNPTPTLIDWKPLVSLKIYVKVSSSSCEAVQDNVSQFL